MAQLKFSTRMDPEKQLRHETPEERQWGTAWWNYVSAVQKLCEGNMSFVQAKAEASRQTGWR